MAKSDDQKAVVASLKISKNDTGSSAVQAADITKRIELITNHVKENKHDFMARRGLLQLVGRRKRLLQYVAKEDPQQYLRIVKTLGLRH